MKDSRAPMLVDYQKLDLFSFNNLAKEWNLDFTQLDPGNLSADLTQFVCEECQLGYAKFSKGILQEGYSPEGVWTFAFVNDTQIFWRNYHVQYPSIIIYAPGSIINAVSSVNFEVFTFSISEESLNGIAKEIHVEEFFESIKSIDLINCQHDHWNQLRMAISEKLDNRVKDPTIEIDKEFVQTFTRNLLKLMKRGSISNDKVSTRKRLSLLQDAVHFMNNNIGEQISVVDIATQFEVSERTLLYAFKNRFKVGPKAFNNILKLNNVHHVLHRSTNEDSIATIARESGFWHMGQFYKDYKRFFGELPSKTLDRSE